MSDIKFLDKIEIKKRDLQGLQTYCSFCHQQNKVEFVVEYLNVKLFVDGYLTDSVFCSIKCAETWIKRIKLRQKKWKITILKERCYEFNTWGMICRLNDKECSSVNCRLNEQNMSLDRSDKTISCENCKLYPCDFYIISLEYKDFLKKVPDLAYICMKNTERK